MLGILNPKPKNNPFYPDGAFVGLGFLLDDIEWIKFRNEGCLKPSCDHTVASGDYRVFFELLQTGSRVFQDITYYSGGSASVSLKIRGHEETLLVFRGSTLTFTSDDYGVFHYNCPMLRDYMESKKEKQDSWDLLAE